MEAGLSAQARARADALAVVAGTQRLTYAELDARAERTAGVLAARGAGPGGRVVCALRNRPAFFDVVFGAARAGAEVVPAPWRSTAEELAYVVEDARAAVLVAEDDAPAAPSLLRLAELDGLRDASATAPDARAAEAPPLLRFYTSGTTGRPKAVERARPEPAAYLAGVVAALEHLGVASADGVHLVAGPLYHAAPLAYAVYALLTGQRVVLPLRFDARESLALIEAERVTWTMMAPVHFLRLLALPEDERVRADVSSMRRLLHGAAPCPPTVKRAIMAMFPGAVWEFYGMTEGRGTLISPDEWLRKPGSVGRPYPGVHIQIRDEDGRVLAPGEPGLIYLRDGTRFTYAGAPEKTAAAWSDDAYTVGDIGLLDEDGYLFLTDRAADVIITGGSNVYPAEVEAALHAHPAVADCVVIGVPDDAWGEHVLAVVQPAADVAPEALIEHCRAHLADYKCPREVVFVDELPRDDAGKIRRREVRAPYWEGRARSI